MIDRINKNFKTRTVNSGPKWRLPWPPKYPDYYDKQCHYLEGLYSTLVHLKPKYCLEIGTHKGDNSTAIFQKYFDDHCPEGLLITLDIKACDNLNYQNVKQVLVYPHHERILETCGAGGRWFNQDELPDNFEQVAASSVQKNSSIVRDAMNDLDVEFFDFAFVDGDHERESFLGDIEISELLTAAPHYIMVDDSKEEYHPCCHIYQEEIKPADKYETYEYDDWDVFVGCSLIWHAS